jgi:GT2 family glycosyltransferase
VTCNLRGPCESAPFQSSRQIFLFKSGFALYQRRLFSEVAGYFPDLFFRDAGELFLANRIYEHGGVVAVAHDAWMFHAHTSQGRYRRDMNFHAVRSHALLTVMQEPLAVIPLSLAAKIATTLYRIAVQRRDPLAWLQGWLSFAAHLPEAARQRRAISWRTYRYTRKLRREAGQTGYVAAVPSVESV